jgi:hypothetical protein
MSLHFRQVKSRYMVLISVHIPTKTNKGVTMIVSRTVGAALLSSALTSLSAGAYAQDGAYDNTVLLYASLGERLLHYAFNTKVGTLEEKGEPVILPLLCRTRKGGSCTRERAP